MKSAQKISCVALLAAATVVLGAQELTYGVKFGGGSTLGGTIGAQGSRAAMNAAFVVERPLSKSAEVFGELNYRVYRSIDQEATRFIVGYNINGTTGQINALSSVDVRKDNLDGYAVNLGYRRKLDETFWLQGGVSLNAMNSQQEVTGQLAPGIATAASVTNANREGLNFTPGKRGLRPGFFAGVQARITPEFFTEVNLSTVGYQWVNFVPYAYSGQPQHVETTTRAKVSLDFNIGFRF